MAAARSSPAESRRDSPDSPCFKAVERRDDTGSEEGDIANRYGGGHNTKIIHQKPIPGYVFIRE